MAADDVSKPGFTDMLIKGNASARSWREKLAVVQDLLADETRALGQAELADVAVYLRFLNTGEIACVEDGRHFRPSHHARIATQIHERLVRLHTNGVGQAFQPAGSSDFPVRCDELATGKSPAPADKNVCPTSGCRVSSESAFLIRKIVACLPSTAAPFQRAEPLTRIRDIAHRNDIPHDLKREIKTTLQNKLHRCAGPEDLVTSQRLLERITAPGTHYSGDFVEQFKIFHGELTEFFNARSLDDRLHALTPSADELTRQLIGEFLRAKQSGNQSEALTGLTQLRQRLIELLATNTGAEHQEYWLTDIALEDYAFVLLSELLNGLHPKPTPDPSKEGKPATSAPDNAPLLGGAGGGLAGEILNLALTNLHLSQIAPDEVAVTQNEVSAALSQFNLDDRDSLLRLKAAVERARRLAGEFSDTVLAHLAERAQLLGPQLGVAPHAIRVFAEGEVRGHVVFQLAKLATEMLRSLRQLLHQPPWDVIVAGQAAGRLVSATRLGELGSTAAFGCGSVRPRAEHERTGTNQAVCSMRPEEWAARARPTAPEAGALPDAAEPQIVALTEAEGDEEIPNGVTGILLAHELPHLSHLGVRARQAGVVVACCEEESLWADIGRKVGEQIQLSASSDGIQITSAKAGATMKTAAQPSARIVPEVQLHTKAVVLPLEKANPTNGGNKSDGARRLFEFSQQRDAGFSAPDGLVVPFGVMELCLQADARTHGEHQALIAKLSDSERAKPQKKSERPLTPSLSPSDGERVADRPGEGLADDFATTLAKIRQLVMQAKVPDSIVAGVVEKFGRAQRLAVRSSANSEDLADMAGAGLHESVVGVTADEIEAALKTVWASLWTERAAASRRQAGIPHESAHMAVLIQPLVEPELSFILHTVNPLNHNPDECYAELAVGLGETLASAAARGTPYRVVCNRESGQVTMLAFANFSQALVAGTSGISVAADVSPLQLNAPKSESRLTSAATERRIDYAHVAFTSQAELRAKLGARLALISNCIEREFGAPQDVEGVIRGDEIILVQSRAQQGIPPTT